MPTRQLQEYTATLGVALRAFSATIDQRSARIRPASDIQVFIRRPHPDVWVATVERVSDDGSITDIGSSADTTLSGAIEGLILAFGDVEVTPW